MSVIGYNISMVEIEIGTNEKGQRFDRFLRKYLPGAPLSYIYKMIRKDAKVNLKRAKDVYMLEEGDVIQLYISEEEMRGYMKKETAQTVRKSFRTAYEDEHLLIVDKPAGLLTHGDKSEKSNHLTNQVQGYLIQKGEYDPQESKTFAPSPVNRIDRNTSGLVIFAKDYDTLKTFNSLIRNREKIRKIYSTVLIGRVDHSFTLDEMMEKNEESNISRVVESSKSTQESSAGESSKEAPRGESSKSTQESSARKSSKEKRAVTHVRPIRCGSIGGRVFTIAEVEIETGRTHQIRVQLSEAGHPIAGDPKYGDSAVNKMLHSRLGLNHQLLTASRLEFDEIEGYSEISGKTVRAKLPGAFTAVKKEIESSRN